MRLPKCGNLLSPKTCDWFAGPAVYCFSHSLSPRPLFTSLPITALLCHSVLFTAVLFTAVLFTAVLFVFEPKVSRGGEIEGVGTTSPIANAVQPVPSLDLAGPSTSDMNLMPPTLVVPKIEFDAVQIADLAAKGSSTANLIRSERLLDRDYSERRSWVFSLARRPESWVQECIASALEQRERERASSTAVQLHHGIAASSVAISMQDDLLRYLEIQQLAQDKLIEQGIGIDDPMLLHRLWLQVEGQRLEASSKSGQLRTQLSLLVGSQVACVYVPVFESNLVPSDSDVCEYLSEAMRCRVDLRLLHSIRCRIGTGDLEEFDRYAADVLGLPLGLESKLRWKAWMKSVGWGRDGELQRRQCWLDALIAARTQQVTVEVEIAFEKKRAAALRWVNARALVDAWKQRILQLERLSEARGNLAEQISARMELAQAEGEVLKRWVEWHEAHAELMLAVGRSQ